MLRQLDRAKAARAVEPVLYTARDVAAMTPVESRWVCWAHRLCVHCCMCSLMRQYAKLHIAAGKGNAATVAHVTSGGQEYYDKSFFAIGASSAAISATPPLVLPIFTFDGTFAKQMMDFYSNVGE